MDNIDSIERNGALQTESLMSDRTLAVWEIISVASSVLIAEWLAGVTSDLTRLVLVVPIGLAFVLTVSSHRLRKETLRDLGFRLDNLAKACALLVVPMIVVALVCVIISRLSGEGLDPFRWHVSRLLAVQLSLGFAWGSLQQYMLQSFVNRRAQLVWGKGWISVLVVALVFGGLHLPNPWLTAITFVGGLIWAAIYQRAPNIFALALSHVLMTWIVVSTLPGSALSHLRVGLGYFE